MGYAGLSDFALYYIGGIIKHANALNAKSPTRGTNSYKRWCLASRRRSTSLLGAQPLRGMPASLTCRPNGRRVEVRFPDPTNEFLPGVRRDAGWRAWTACRTRSTRRDPSTKNMYDLRRGGSQGAARVRLARAGARAPARPDHAFLTKGGVFSDDFSITSAQGRGN